MTKIYEYDIIAAGHVGELAMFMDRKIQEGWIPFGNIFIDTFSAICQPVVRIRATAEERQMEKLEREGNESYPKEM